APKLTLEKADKRSIDAASTIVSPHASCTIAQSYRPTSSVHYQEFQGDVAHEECQSARLKDEAWLTTKCISRDKTTSSSERRTTDGVNDDGENSDPVRDEQTHCLPTWSAFNSQLARDDDSTLTCIRTMPLLASPAHEYSTLLNVFRQTQLVSDQIVGPDSPVILTMDMDLYQRALKLQIAKPELQGRIILRIGELHTVFCMLRTIGSFIEGSGFDDSWIEAGIYGSSTTRQILEGKHMKRGISAHITSLQALFDLYVGSFVNTEPDMSDVQEKVASDIKGEYNAASYEEMKHGVAEKVGTIMKASGLPAKLENFSQEKMHQPMFAWTKMYMEMILVLLQYIRASREGNWLLHLQSLEKFCPYFFSMNRLKYAQCAPEYIAKMYALQTSKPEVWKWLCDGNFCVKKSHVAFSKIGVDHALEQVNRSLKVLGGITGITTNADALARFFLVAHEVSRLAEESERQVGLQSTATSLNHRDLSKSVVGKEETNVRKLRDVFK
ncbi:MAG: hypothetical protein ABW185_17125, partial [Sedimenticola sp.]